MARVIRTWMSRHIGISVFVVVLFSLAAAVIAVQQITIISPKAREMVYGTIRILAKPTDESGMNYALLLLDRKGRSVTNTMPLHFELDTTQLENGSHMLQVDVYDNLGNVTSSQPLPILVLNPPADTFNHPPLTRVTPLPSTRIAKVMPAPTTAHAPVAPVAPAAPVTVTPMASIPSANTLISMVPKPEIPLGQPPIVVTPESNTDQHIVIPGTNKRLVLLLDGKPMVMEREPFIVNGHTMVLLRPLVTAAGGSLDWKGERGTAIVDGRTIQFTLGAPEAILDGAPFNIDQPLVEVQGRVVAPVTIWRDLFAGRVGYEATPRCVWLRSPDTVAAARYAE